MSKPIPLPPSFYQKHEDASGNEVGPPIPYWNQAAVEEAVRQALAAQVPLVDEPVCPRCGGTGEADSGGIHPWGAPALIPCECTVSASGHKPASVDTSCGHSAPETRDG